MNDSETDSPSIKALIVFRENGETDNLFVPILCDAIRMAGIDVRCSTKEFWDSDKHYDIIHFQWPEEVVKVLNEVRNRADGEDTDKYTTDMSPDKLAEAAYDEHGWEMAGYYWGGIASRARDMFRMYRYKDHFESRKLNEPIEVAHDVFRKEAVAVTGTWDDSKMYVPYPYEDVILNPNLDNSWKN